MPVFGPGSGGVAAAGIGITSVTMPLELPTAPSPSSSVLRMGNQVAVAQSPFTLSRQVQEWQGERIVFDVTYPPMLADQARAWVATLAALRGQSGSCLFSDSSQPVPRGVATGVPVVDGAGQSGKILNLRGFTVSTALILRSGDWIGIGSGLQSRLYMNLLDVASDAAGKVTLNIWPRLRESPVDNAGVVVNAPRGVFALASNDRAISIDNSLHYGIQLSLEEAL